MYIIAGLGNPGSKYENTRHNAGFMALDAIAEEAGVSVDRMQFKGFTARAQLGGKSVLLLKPSTFMNLSGESIQEAMQFYHLPPENQAKPFYAVLRLFPPCRSRAFPL